MNSDQIEIADYIRRYHNTYTWEAIERQLLDAGYDSADIRAGWEEITNPPQPNPPSVWSWVALCLLWLLFFIIAGIIQIGTELLFGFTSYGRDTNDSLLTFLHVLFALSQIGIITLGIYLLYKRRSLRKALTVITVCSFAWYAIITGTCLIGAS